jgi:hypothetical protein
MRGNDRNMVSERDDETLKFVLLGPHDEAYGI